MPKLKFKADQLAPLAVCLPLPPLHTPCVFPPLPRTVTIQLDLKFDYKIPSTKCAIGKHFSAVRARVWNLFWPTNNFSRFLCSLWEIVTVSKSFFVCHWFVGPVTQRHFVTSQRKFPTAEYDEYNSPLINTIPPLSFILYVTAVTTRFIIT